MEDDAADRYDFFIAHAGGDTPAAEELYDHLDPYAEVFLDSRCLLPGDVWDVELPKAQSASAITVMLVSKQTDTAWYAREEIASAIDLARHHQKRVAPVYLDGPPADYEDVLYGLRRLHSLTVTTTMPISEVSRELLRVVGKESPAAAAGPADVVGLPARPDTYVRRDGLMARLKQAVLADEPVALTGVVGAGGFGKTTLAAAVCRDDEVVERYGQRIAWVTLGETAVSAPHVTTALQTLHRRVTGRPLEEADPALAVEAVRRALSRGRWLVVFDDVWSHTLLEPLRQAAAEATVVVTTRKQDVVGVHGESIDVDELSTGEAVQLLLGTAAADPGHGQDVRALAERLDGWALLVELAGRQLARRIDAGQTVADASSELVDRHRQRGAAAFDARKPEQRADAIATTMAVSLEALHPDDQWRCLELGVLPEDVDVPTSVVAELWGMPFFDAEDVLLDLHGDRLVRYRTDAKTVRIHDEVRSFLAATLNDPRLVPSLDTSDQELGAAAAVHARLLDAWGDLHQLPHEYAWSHLAHHAQAADQVDRFTDLLFDATWLLRRIEVTGVGSLLADLTLLADDLPQDARTVAATLRLVASVLANHPEELPGQFAGRLRPEGSPSLQRLVDSCPEAAAATLLPVRPTLEPAGAVRQVLHGHTDTVLAVAVAPNGTIVSASADQTVRLWAADGTPGPVLDGHTDEVSAVAVAPDGTIVSGSADRTVRFWAADGTPGPVLDGHTGGVRAVAVAPDSTVVSGAGDGTVRLWAADGTPGPVLDDHTGGVRAVAVAPDGTIVAAWNDGSVRLWAADGTPARR